MFTIAPGITAGISSALSVLPRRMRALPVALLLVSGAAPAAGRLPVAQPNDNRVPAGSLRGGVLTVTLEAALVQWYPDGDSLPGMRVEAFGEPGHEPTAPGPLLRVPAGTALRISVRNLLEHDTTTFYVPALAGGAADGPAMDSVVVRPREVRVLAVMASRPGNWLFHCQ